MDPRSPLAGAEKAQLVCSTVWRFLQMPDTPNTTRPAIPAAKRKANIHRRKIVYTRVHNSTMHGGPKSEIPRRPGSG